MDRNAQDCRIPWLGIDMMTPVHPLQLPAVGFKDATKAPA
jgi:hypothetical protein